MDYFELLEQNDELRNNQDRIFEIILDSKTIEEWVINKREELITRGLPEEWGDIGVVYQDPYILILRDLVRFPNGCLGSYFRIINSADLRGGQGTVILPVVASKILLLRQFRHPTRSKHWEVPRGFGEPDTPPEENAKKEIGEEVGGEIAELIDLGPYHSNTGIEGAIVKLYFARLSKIGEANNNEGIETYEFVEVSKFEEMIRDAEITDGFTIAAFTRARLRGLI
jgi:ADP-ribose diphosphatase